MASGGGLGLLLESVDNLGPLLSPLAMVLSRSQSPCYQSWAVSGLKGPQSVSLFLSLYSSVIRITFIYTFVGTVFRRGFVNGKYG